MRLKVRHMSARLCASALVDALGAETLKQWVVEGDIPLCWVTSSGLWTVGYLIMNQEEGNGTPRYAAGRSPKANADNA